MASVIIHLVIAKELRQYLNINNEKDYYLGSIAPDIWKHIKIERKTTHFEYNKKIDIPNLTMFREKYSNYKENDFLLGYYIHLYTDKLWFKKFLPSKCYDNSIKLIDGTIYKTNNEEIQKLLYQDYTNLNIQLIERHNMDLSLFYEEFKIPNTNFNDFSLDKLNILIDKMGIIIENSKQEKSYIMDLYEIENFIKETIETIKKDIL